MNLSFCVELIAADIDLLLFILSVSVVDMLVIIQYSVLVVRSAYTGNIEVA